MFRFKRPTLPILNLLTILSMTPLYWSLFITQLDSFTALTVCFPICFQMFIYCCPPSPIAQSPNPFHIKIPKSRVRWGFVYWVHRKATRGNNDPSATSNLRSVSPMSGYRFTVLFLSLLFFKICFVSSVAVNFRLTTSFCQFYRSLSSFCTKLQHPFPVFFPSELSSYEIPLPICVCHPCTIYLYLKAKSED